MLAKLEPVEKVRLDNVRLEDLYDRLGPIGAENVISRAMEELAVRLSKISKSYEKGHLNDTRKVANSIATIADQVGMSVLAGIARTVAELTTHNDGAALSAVVARLVRLGERSLIAVWDLQDLSV